MSVGTTVDWPHTSTLRVGELQGGRHGADRSALAVVALTILAAILRFAYIGHQGFWFDEGNTALLVHHSFASMLGLIPHEESTPPLYYSLAWVWARMFGNGEAALRSFSALAGTATVPVAFAAGRKLLSARTGVIVAALVACSPVLIWYSQEARSYALLVLLSSCSLLAFAYVRENPSLRLLLAWVVVAALALATHYYALLAVAPQAVWLLAQHRRRRGKVIAVAVVAACGLALIPLASSQSATGHASWISTVPLDRRLSQVLPQFMAGFQLPAQAVLVPLAGALCVLALALALARDGERTQGRVLGLTGLFFAGLLLNLVLVTVGVDDLLTRNLLALWLPAALAVAAGLGARRAGRVGVLAAVALCGIGLVSAIGVDANRDYQRPDWRGVARLLGAHPGPGTGQRAIFVQNYGDLLPLSLYLPGLRVMPRHGAHVRELDIVSFTSPPSGGFCWWGSACNLWPSRIQPGYPVPGFREVSRRRVYQFTVVRMVADAPTLVTRREIGLVLTTTRLRNDGLLLQR